MCRQEIFSLIPGCSSCSNSNLANRKVDGKDTSIDDVYNDK